MLISLNWLKNYIDLEGISPEVIEEKLTISGLEVDEIIDEAKNFENFVVGFVKDKKKHPNADRLSLCIVDDGTEEHPVVCGAPNVEAGQKIAFAKVGAVIPNGEFKIKKAKIRGEVSKGMICAEDELSLSDDHSGIMVLDEDLSNGTPLAKALGKDDVVFDIEVTPNRADALSHIGVARDLAALLDKELKKPEIKSDEISSASSDEASIEIENEIACPRYVGKVVKNVTVKESPNWLKKNLISIGLRPINNVVDVTNYVLHEVGQPLHGFDLDKLAGKKIVVKNASEGEKFVTLDSKERELKATDLMICDGEKPVAIAGVMGGENSEVSETTKNVLIESAYFDPSTIRKTSKRLTLSTDASYRFERGCDPSIADWAARRAAQLLAEVADGEVCKGEIDVYPNEIKERSVELRFKRVEKVLGYQVPEKEITKIMNGLQFNIVEENDEKLVVGVPTFRNDIEREIDLIEEVARIYGYEEIPAVEKIAVTLDEKVNESAFGNKAREISVGLGFNEIITNSLLNSELANIFGKPISVMNPQTSEMTHLRPSLLPGALYTISKNLKVKENNLTLFEIGKTFNKLNDGIDSFKDFIEIENLQLVISGYAKEDEWYEKSRKFDVYDLKGYVEHFIDSLFPGVETTEEYYMEGKEIFEYAYSVKIGKTEIGLGGKVNTDITDKFDIDEDVFAFNFNLTELAKISSKERKFEELLKYPKIYKDFAFILDKDILVETVIKTINNGTSKLLKNVKLFDIFESKNLGEGKKSLAFELEFYDKTKTLTDEVVDKEFRKAIKAVESKLNGKLRGE